MDVATEDRGQRAWWQRALAGTRKLLGGIGEGFAAAGRYERLAVLSDTQLQRMGLTRRDIAWYALYGEARPEFAARPQPRVAPAARPAPRPAPAVVRERELEAA